jgi:rRNA pseudouridine-1189 N-methylase Emg1 (Nep1/Mra1 family)
LIPPRVREHRVFVGCGHFEHGDKSASLTRTMKVCSQKREELEAWAHEHVGGRLKTGRSCM